ncbi:MAG: hypothetical protein CVU64_14435 [Deltaproteobacteria bacterium HGW-Deltaproteobacteria-21]|nr:MAG: hypothetical protein CVU64_14435 [Deltaproteobacteria bacterium HGW-Deltaproteobacteria-21]
MVAGGRRVEAGVCGNPGPLDQVREQLAQPEKHVLEKVSVRHELHPSGANKAGPSGVGFLL